MKKKLKQWRLDLATAKTAWTTARKAKKPDEEVKRLHAEYLKIAQIVDDAEAADAKDDDEVEAPAPATSPDEGKVITTDELKTMLQTTMADELKKHVPAEHKDAITAKTVEDIVERVLTKHAKGAATVPVKDIKVIMGEVAQEQYAALKLPSKQQHDTDAKNHEGKVVIELPLGMTKGNLPLHMKQLLNIMKKRPMDEGIDAAVITKGIELGDRMVAKYAGMARAGQKAMTSTGAGIGDEWVPTDLSSELQRRFYLTSDLAAYMLGKEIDMPTQPFEMPLSTTRPTFFLETTENTAATASDPGTGKITLDAKKLMGRVDFSYEVDEDSIIPVLPTVQTLLSEAAADAYESALINGDTAGTHQDTDTQAIPKAAERAFNGFRKLALAVAALKIDLTTGGINEANLRSLKKALRKYGVRPRDLLWITGPAGINDMQGIANVTTLEKYGPRATILTGELASFLGIPIITSERNREDLNAAGVNDGVTTTKGSILLVNTRGWVPGRRREFTVEVDKDIKTQTHFLVASFRRAFQVIETPSATIRWLAIGYNYNA